MRLLPTLTITSLATLAVALPASAAAPGQRVPVSPAAAAAIARETEALKLLNAATRHVRQTRKDCAPDPAAFTSKPDLSTAPDPALLAVLAPLRRPATPEELSAFTSADGHRRLSPPGGLYTNFVRRVTAANGRVVTIAIARETPFYKKRPSSCLTAETARLRRLLNGQPQQVKTIALHYLRLNHREELRARDQQPFDGVFSYEVDEHGTGGGGGGGGVERFKRFGNFISSGSRGGTEVTGVVPDGVAAVRFDYPKRVGRGRYYKPVTYPRAISRTVRVRDNVLSFHVTGRAPEDALPRRMTWLAADGSVLRVVRP